MYGARAKEILQSRFSEMVRDKRVSDAEIEIFEKSAEALGARIELLLGGQLGVWHNNLDKFRHCSR